MWTGFELEKQINSKVDVEIEQEIRWNENISEFHKAFSDVSVSYSLLPLIEISGKYRYIFYTDKEKARIGFDCKFSPGDYLIEPNYRVRFQKDYEDDEDPQDWVLRNKVTLEYPHIDSFSPFISGEVYHILEDASTSKDKYRISFGIEYPFRDNHSLEVFYIYQRTLEKSDFEVTNVIGTKYEFTIK